MKITDDHWLEGAVKALIPGGAEMKVRRCVVIHFTAGATGASSVESMRNQGLSAHFVVERDGTILQCRPCNRVCAHAGKSRWQDPKTGKTYGSANEYAIGIEIANAGNDPGALKWAKKQPGARTIRAKHRNGGPEYEWEAFPEKQVSAVFALTQALVKRYNLDDIIGHDDCAPERKMDPGPAFPMLDLRRHCGFDGLPKVHWK